jgi:hypothetical protein
MRIFTVAACSALALLGLSGQNGSAQIVIGPGRSSIAIITNRAAISSNSAAVINRQSLTPNLASSNATPAIGRPGITPAMPSSGSTAITPNGVAGAVTPKGGVTTSIGRQGFGGAIGQQGSGTALGQQGSGTAIGQQGTGTAIIPQNNAVVIGQPEPFSPPPVSVPTPTGFSTNGLPPGSVPSVATNNLAPANRGVPTAVKPAAAPVTGARVSPTGRR